MGLGAVLLLDFPVLVAGRGWAEVDLGQIFMAALLLLFEKDILFTASCLPCAVEAIASVFGLRPAVFLLLICAKDGGPRPDSVNIAEIRLWIVIVEADDRSLVVLPEEIDVHAVVLLHAKKGSNKKYLLYRIKKVLSICEEMRCGWRSVVVADDLEGVRWVGVEGGWGGVIN